MSYYTGMGDYYSGKGDPGLFGFLGKAIGSVARVGASMVPGPGGSILRAAAGRLPGFRRSSRAPVGAPVPSFQAPVLQYARDSRTAAVVPGMTADTMGFKKKRRRMNYGNVKALRRADRRVDGFVGVARRALKHTNYKVVSRSAGRSGGSRGVITRSEAAKALRA